MPLVLMEAPPSQRPEPGAVLLLHGLVDEALPYLLEKVRRVPKSASGWNDLAVCHRRRGDWRSALTCAQQALSLETHGAVIHNLGMIYEDAGNFERAEAYYEAAVNGLQGHPDAWQAQLALAGCLLRRGERQKAWPLWNQARAVKSYVTLPQVPMWEGQDLKGKRIVVTREGGHGDAFWLLRYLKCLKEQGAGEVAFCCVKSMQVLLSGHPWIDKLIPSDEPIEFDYDYQIPLQGIMAVVDKFPLVVDAPYLSVRSKIEFGGPAVGLCWKAEEAPIVWRKARGLDESLLAQLQEVPVNWVSLQYGERAPWMQDAQDYMALGWQGTAAVIAGLDCVVTADTAIFHLAAAMNKPTIVFVPLNSDAKFFFGGTDSPWYSSCRVVRNSDANSFAPAVEEICSILRQRFELPEAVCV